MFTRVGKFILIVLLSLYVNPFCKGGWGGGGGLLLKDCALTGEEILSLIISSI